METYGVTCSHMHYCPSLKRCCVLSGIKKAMAKSMTEALKIPHFGYNDEIDMSNLVKLRKELKGSAILGGVAFSYMPVIIKVKKIHCE